MKTKRFCLVAILMLCVFLIAGCGEKDKFDKAHAEVIQLMEQSKTIKAHDIQIRRNEDWSSNQDDVKAVEDDLVDTEKRHQEIIDKVNAKLEEMQGYADKEASLAPKLEYIKKDVKEQSDQWQAGINELRAINDMHKNDGPGRAPIYDPYKAKGVLHWDL